MSVSPTTSLRTWTPSARPAAAAVVASAALYAFLPVLVRDLTGAGMSPIAIVFFRMLIPAVALVRYIDVRPDRRAATTWALGVGVVIGIGWVGHVEVIRSGAVGTAALAYMTYPLFAIAMAALLFGRRPSPRSLVAGLVVVVAAIIGLGPASADAWNPIVLLAPLTIGGSIAILVERLHVLDGLARLATVTLGAALGLSPLVAHLPVDSVVPDASALPTLAACGIACALVPMFLYGAAAPTLGAAGASLVGSIELPLTFAVAIVVLGEPAQGGQLLAGALIAVAIVVTATDRRGSHHRSELVETATDRRRSHHRSELVVTATDRRSSHPRFAPVETSPTGQVGRIARRQPATPSSASSIASPHPNQSISWLSSAGGSGSASPPSMR